jgi:phenylacetate-coenzyme A ligase PaaK-like adenylate-forming protein
MNLPNWLIAAAHRVPLYLSLPERPGWPSYSHTAEDLESVAAGRDDPFGGRHDLTCSADVLIQAARGLPIYWALAASDVRAFSTVLASGWTDLGIKAGQRVAFYDYATSPVVVYASRAYLPHLDGGAADLIGCLPICNDGLPDLADRCVHILEYMRPSVLFVEGELMDPLLRALDRKNVNATCQVVVSSDEGAVGSGRISEWSALLKTDVKQMLRADTPLFFAPPCPIEPMTFHPHEEAYHVEVVSSNPLRALANEVGLITVTNLAIRSSIVIRYVTNIEGSVREGPCRCGRAGRRVIVTNVN